MTFKLADSTAWPPAFDTRHLYVPSSSGNTSDIWSDTVSPSCVIRKYFEGLITLSPFCHFTDIAVIIKKKNNMNTKLSPFNFFCVTYEVVQISYSWTSRVVPHESLVRITAEWLLVPVLYHWVLIWAYPSVPRVGLPTELHTLLRQNCWWPHTHRFRCLR